MGKRVLITGLGAFWGGRAALALEKDPDVEMIVGLDTIEPKVELERTEYVRADQSYSILARIVEATQVDTILHTFLEMDSTRMSGRKLHEINVIGTMNLLAAAGAPGSSVRHIIVKSSTLVYGANQSDPAWFREEMTRTAPPRTRVERSIIEVEGYLRDFA
ncbi:MAG: UDP-glucose 4-epimerase, partial [Actinomycetota bacterium]